MIDNVRRKLILATAGLGAASLFGLSKARQLSIDTVTKNTTAADAKLGINLSSIEYWATEFPFIDLFKQSHEWFVDGEKADDSAPEVDIDGWVTKLLKGQKATATISAVDNRHFPSGDYVVLYDGEGDINIPNHSIQSKKPGRLTVQVNGGKGGLKLEIVKTNPKNYIRNIRFVPKGYENTYTEMHWNPSFLERWSGVSCLRFMDYGRTNNSAQVEWAHRAKPTDASFVKNGVPVEWMVDLANKLNCDAWFCMPHQANDDYVSQYAQYVAQHLRPTLRAWVEYSNEVWNGSFKQHTYAKKAGLNLKLTKHEWQAASKFYAQRSVQTFNLWEKAFTDQQRLVRVLASQSANADIAKQILGFELPNNRTAASYADVLAIADYVHLGVSGSSKPNDQAVANWTLDELFDYMNDTALPESKSWVLNNKRVAEQYDLKLVAYEAGQHVAAYGDSVNNDKLTKLFISANGDSRMGDVYAESLANWQTVGGGLVCSYHSVGRWSKWGSWGLLENHDDQPTPKFKAVMDWAKSRGQKVSY